MEQTLKHRVGDIVKIKSREWYDKNKDLEGEIYLKDCAFAAPMAKYLGKTATITAITDSISYCLDIDKQDWHWHWTDDMFEDEVIPKEKEVLAPKKEIDWEQRRWELIKIFLLSAEKSGVEFQTNEEELDAVIDLTDKFIKLLKK